MHTMTRVFCASALALCSSLTLAGTADQQARQQWHQAIGEGYQALAVASGHLQSAADDYCATANDSNRNTLNTAWQQAFLAWQQVRFVDFGPVEQNNLSWQFQFWPDPKNLIAKKANALMGMEQPVTAKQVAQSGVAVQGFPMLEYLLYDTRHLNSDHALPASSACSLLLAVSRHMHSNSENLAASWRSFESRYLETDAYRDTTIRAGMGALEILEERRLAQPMGLRGNGKRNAYITDAWRSGQSMKAAEATVTGLKQRFLPGLTTLLTAEEHVALASRIQKQFDEVLENFPAADLPITTAIKQDDQFRVVQSLYVDVSQLATMVNNEAAVALGVVRGFNSSDGD